MNDMNHMINLPDRADPLPEWELEPNEVTFVSHGYWCEIKRNPAHGALCGYVLMGAHHPWANLGYDVEVAVHGGITYNDGKKMGFDCAHADDLIPLIHTRIAHSNPAKGETYRNMAWVKAEVQNLAAQLRAVDPIMDIQPREKPNE